MIEMVVAIAIMTIIAGIGISSYFKMKPAIRINGAARDMMGNLMWAKMKAVSENNNYAIAFGTSTNSYKIYDDNDNDFSVTNVEIDELVKSGTISSKYEGVRFGFVAPVDKVTGGTLGTDDDPVTFPWQGSGIRWFRFEPDGKTGGATAGGIYLVLDDDLADNRMDRMRAISVSTTGRVKIWEYNNGAGEWK